MQPVTTTELTCPLYRQSLLGLMRRNVKLNSQVCGLYPKHINEQCPLSNFYDCVILHGCLSLSASIQDSLLSFNLEFV